MTLFKFICLPHLADEGVDMTKLPPHPMPQDTEVLISGIWNFYLFELIMLTMLTLPTSHKNTIIL